MDFSSLLPEELTADVFRWVTHSDNPQIEALLSSVAKGWRRVVRCTNFTRTTTLDLCPVALARIQRSMESGDFRRKRAWLQRVRIHRGTVHISTAFTTTPDTLHYALLEILACMRGVTALSWHDSSLASSVPRYLQENPPRDEKCLPVHLLRALWTALQNSAGSLRYLSVRGKFFDEIERSRDLPREQLVLPRLRYLSFSAAALEFLHCPALGCFHNFRFEPSDGLLSFLKRHEHQLQCIFMNYDQRDISRAPIIAERRCNFSRLEVLKVQVSRGDARLECLRPLASDQLRHLHVSQLPSMSAGPSEAHSALTSFLNFLCKSQRSLRTLIFEAPTCERHMKNILVPSALKLKHLEAVGMSAATFCFIFWDSTIAPSLHTLFCRQLNLERMGLTVEDWARVLNSRSALRCLGLPGAPLSMPPLHYVAELKLLSGDCVQLELVDFDCLAVLRSLQVSGPIRAEALVAMIDRLSPEELTVAGRVLGEFDSGRVMAQFDFLRRAEFPRETDDQEDGAKLGPANRVANQLVRLTRGSDGGLCSTESAARPWPGEDVIASAPRPWWYANALLRGGETRMRFLPDVIRSPFCLSVFV